MVYHDIADLSICGDVSRVCNDTAMQALVLQFHAANRSVKQVAHFVRSTTFDFPRIFDLGNSLEYFPEHMPQGRPSR